jgi:hypothetical protein
MALRAQKRIMDKLNAAPVAEGPASGVDAVADAVTLPRTIVESTLETLDYYADPHSHNDGFGDSYDADDEVHPGIGAQHAVSNLRAALATPPASEAVTASLTKERDDAVERYGIAIAEAARLRARDEVQRKALTRYMNDDVYTRAERAEKRAEAAEAQVATLTAALAFIDSHVADPDITDEMAKNWARLQEARASLASQQEG